MKSRKLAYLERQGGLLTARQISRRQFVMSAVAAGVALPTALTMASDAMAATPKKGGLYRAGFGHGSTTDSLDPATYENSIMTQVCFSYGNHLTEVGPDGQLRPELAESWEASTDAKTWTFKVRQGVEFHNGKTLTADDMMASLNYHRGEDSKSAAKGLLSGITEMRADGGNLVVDLAEGNADFPFIVSDYHLVVLPSSDGKVDPTAGIGTGPYKMDEFEPGVRFLGSRNPNYFKSDAAYFDGVQYLSILDLTARQNAMLNDEVDSIDRVDPKTVTLLARAPHVNILETTGTLHYTFPMRVDAAPFDNVDVRLALKHAVKRQELVDKILLGHGALGNDHPISSANPFHASTIEQREFDPDKARHHYEKSGHSGAIQLSASDAAFSGAVDAAQLIAASAAEAGINIEVVREPTDGYWSNVWNKKPWCACYWGGRPTEDWMFSSAYVADTEWNDTAWRTTDGAVRFNEVVKQARAELDNDKRRALYHEAQLLIRDDGGALVPMFANHIHALNSRVGTSSDVAGNWQYDGGKSHERWWFS
ncbi:MAG: ABC transporter substrate-binding protein [Rhodobacteraceae bacterium]|nr:ABC transporter substrate-binding protein [Paracoccaceae bacterium]